MLRLALLLGCILSFSAPAAAQDADSTARGPLDFDAIRQEVEEDLRNRASTATPPVFPEGAGLLPDADSLTQARQQEALQAYFNYRVEGFDHRHRVFEWQLLSSRIIFVIVILLVVVGVYFSGVQFHRGTLARLESESDESEARTELEASMQGIKVSSSTLGVIILVISLAFFYLYLVYVYPIEEIF